MRNFKALAQTVASNWRLVDSVTLSYCKSVAEIIKVRHAELTRGASQEGLQQNKKMKKMQSKMMTAKKAPASAGPMALSSFLEEEAQEGPPCNSPPSSKTNTAGMGSIMNSTSYNSHGTTQLEEETNYVQEVRASKVITPLANIFDQVEDTIVGQQPDMVHHHTEITSSSVLTSLMSAVDPSEDITGLNIHDMVFVQLDGRKTNNAILSASNYMFPILEQSMMGMEDFYDEGLCITGCDADELMALLDDD